MNEVIPLRDTGLRVSSSIQRMLSTYAMAMGESPTSVRLSRKAYLWLVAESLGRTRGITLSEFNEAKGVLVTPPISIHRSEVPEFIDIQGPYGSVRITGDDHE